MRDLLKSLVNTSLSAIDRAERVYRVSVFDAKSLRLRRSLSFGELSSSLRSMLGILQDPLPYSPLKQQLQRPFGCSDDAVARSQYLFLVSGSWSLFSVAGPCLSCFLFFCYSHFVVLFSCVLVSRSHFSSRVRFPCSFTSRFLACWMFVRNQRRSDRVEATGVVYIRCSIDQS